MREGEWKLVSEVGQGWELYNMSEDRTEQYDLSETEADRLKYMQAAYHECCLLYTSDAADERSV